MATWKASIEVYTREIETGDMTDAQLGVLIADTVNEWIEKVPLELLYKHAAESIDLPNEGIDITDKKIIKVYRDDKLAVLKEFEKKYLFTDTGSLHYASKYTPVWYIENMGTSEVDDETYEGPYLKIFPLLEGEEKARAYLYSYVDTVTAGAETTSDIPGVPPRMAPLIVLSTAEKVLAHKLGMMVHEEEDSEVTQIINVQLQHIMKLISEQASRIGIGQEIQNPMTMYTKGQQ